jgi:hypothetical protein
LEGENISADEILCRAKRAGVRVTLVGEDLDYDAPEQPAHDILDSLAEHRAAIIDLLRNRVCQQCGEGDGVQTLVDGIWIHDECAAYRQRRGIPWGTTLEELVPMTIADVTVAAANARLEIPKPRAKRRAA